MIWTYETYMASPEWEQRRKLYFTMYGYRCFVCNVTENLNVHHLDYKRLGDEPDYDLMPLCQSCHKKVHLLHDELKGSLRFATYRFLQQNNRSNIIKDLNKLRKNAKRKIYSKDNRRYRTLPRIERPIYVISRAQSGLKTYGPKKLLQEKRLLSIV